MGWVRRETQPDFSCRYLYHLRFGEGQTVLVFTFYKGCWTVSHRNSETSHKKIIQEINKTLSSEGFKELSLFSLSENERQLDYRNKASGTKELFDLVDTVKCL